MIKFKKGGADKTVLVFLHGWGKKKEDYAELVSRLAKQYSVYALDLPGFGTEPMRKAMDLADYASWLAEYLRKKKIDEAIFVGHSFGGRVAIKLAVSRPGLVSTLVLIDSGGIERKSLRVKAVKWLTAVTPSRVRELLRPMVGSKDYLESIGLVRETMKKIVAENLEFELPSIKIPTLIVWGRDDHTTPLWQGELMHRGIAGSKLEVIPGDHGIPYRKAEEVAGIVLEYVFTARNH